MVKTFLAALIGSFIGTALMISAAVKHFEPMIALTGAAAEKTIGHAEAERLVREKLGREWHAGE